MPVKSHPPSLLAIGKPQSETGLLWSVFSINRIIGTFFAMRLLFSSMMLSEIAPCCCVYQLSIPLCCRIVLYASCPCSVTKSCPTLGDPWTLTHQAPLSMGVSRQEYWSGLPFPPPGILVTHGRNPCLPHCQVVLYRGATWKPYQVYRNLFIHLQDEAHLKCFQL